MAAESPLRIRDASNNLLVSLDGDDHLLDRNGVTIGRFDDGAREVIVGDIHQTLDGVLLVGDQSIELRLPIGTTKFELSGDEIRTDGHTFGRVEGLPASRQGLRRLGAALVAVPMLPIDRGLDAGQ